MNMHVDTDHLSPEAVTAQAARIREVNREGPETQEWYEQIVRDRHEDEAAVRHLAKIGADKYLESVDGSAKRAAQMYVHANRLIIGNNAPDAVMNVGVEISNSWLAATAAAPCETEDDRDGKLSALIQYLTVDAEDVLELDPSIETIVGQLRDYLASNATPPRRASHQGRFPTI